jgi:sugar lactone lactonase YvrE
MLTLLLVAAFLADSTVPVHARNARYYALAADSASRTGDCRAALRFMRALDSLAPMNPYIPYHMGAYAAQCGRRQAALAALARAARMGYTRRVDTETLFATWRWRTDRQFAHVAAAFADNRRPLSSSTPAFALDDPRVMPEDITYDSADGSFYLGSLAEHKVIRVAPGGAITDITRPEDGLVRVVGMKVDWHRRLLWFATWLPAKPVDRTQLVRYDLDAHRITAVLTLGDTLRGHTFNDVVLTSNGTVFITETDDDAIYRVRPDTDALERFVQLDSARWTAPNGVAISPDGARLYVAMTEGLAAIDVDTRRVRYVDGPHDVSTSNIDGLYWYDAGLVAIQIQGDLERVVRYDLDATGLRITRARVLERNTPILQDPTSGVIVGHTFYYIANSQYRLLADDGHLTTMPLPTVIQQIDLASKTRPR